MEDPFEIISQAIVHLGEQRLAGLELRKEHGGCQKGSQSCHPLVWHSPLVQVTLLERLRMIVDQREGDLRQFRSRNQRGGTRSEGNVTRCKPLVPVRLRGSVRQALGKQPDDADQGEDAVALRKRILGPGCPTARDLLALFGGQCLDECSLPHRKVPADPEKFSEVGRVALLPVAGGEGDREGKTDVAVRVIHGKVAAAVAGQPVDRLGAIGETSHPVAVDEEGSGGRIGLLVGGRIDFSDQEIGGGQAAWVPLITMPVKHPQIRPAQRVNLVVAPCGEGLGVMALGCLPAHFLQSGSVEVHGLAKNLAESGGIGGDGGGACAELQ